MRIPIILPDLGMKSVEIIFGSWLVEKGARVEKGQELFEVEADKATVVVEAESDGTLAEILVTEGRVSEGDILGYLEVGEEEAEDSSEVKDF